MAGVCMAMDGSGLPVDDEWLNMPRITALPIAAVFPKPADMLPRLAASPAGSRRRRVTRAPDVAGVS